MAGADFSADVDKLEKVGKKWFDGLESDFDLAWRQTKDLEITSSNIFGEGAEGAEDLRRTYEETREELGWAMWKLSTTMPEVAEALAKIAAAYKKVDRYKAG